METNVDRLREPCSDKRLHSTPQTTAACSKPLLQITPQHPKSDAEPFAGRMHTTAAPARRTPQRYIRIIDIREMNNATR